MKKWIRSGVLVAAVFGLAPPVNAADHFLILSGLGGEDSYEAAFDAQVGRMRESALNLVNDPAQLQVLSGERASLENIRMAFARLSRDLRPGDRLMVFLVGHGTYDGQDYKFNIPGPDLTGSELNQLLDSLPAREQLIAVMTSASGAVLESLAGEQRLVITATRSGFQRNAPVFGHFWATGLSADAADSNRNELITAAELFSFTADQVARHYQSDALLATEHAQISDPELAERFVVARIGLLGRSSLSRVTSSLLEQRTAVEARIQELMASRGQYSEGDYFDRLESLMLELGQVQRRIDQELGADRAP